MRIWRLIQPGRSLLRLVQAAAGYAMVAFYFKHLDRNAIPAVGALLVSVAAIAAAGHLWSAIFKAGATTRQERLFAPRHKKEIYTRVFLTASVLTLAGLLLALDHGFTAFSIALALTMLQLLHATITAKLEILGELVQGLYSAGIILLGMSAYPLLWLAGTSPYLLTPLILQGIFAAVMACIWLPKENEANLPLAVAATLTGLVIALAILAIYPQTTLGLMVVILAMLLLCVFLSAVKILGKSVGAQRFSDGALASEVLLAYAGAVAFSHSLPLRLSLPVLIPVFILFLVACALAWNKRSSLIRLG